MIARRTTPIGSPRHRDIIRRIGRFPHRNAILARETTEDETDFLANDGFPD